MLQLLPVFEITCKIIQTFFLRIFVTKFYHEMTNKLMKGYMLKKSHIRQFIENPFYIEIPVTSL